MLNDSSDPKCCAGSSSNPHHRLPQASRDQRDMTGRHFSPTSETLPPRTMIEEVRDACHRDHARTQDTSDIGLGASSMSTLLDPISSRVGGGAGSSSSSPPPEDSMDMDFVAPLRPKSTPFPYPEHRRRKDRYCCSEDSDDSNVREVESNSDSETTLFDSIQDFVPSIRLPDLPIEIQEGILDHIFGSRVSPTSRSSMKVSSVKRIDYTAMRHCRRRELTDLSLISKVWRVLIQQRLYRHIKLKGTIDYLEEAMVHFAQHLHLQSYVKHIEIWFPVFQPSYGAMTSYSTLALPTVTTDGLTNATYTLPGNNCSLQQVFVFVSQTLPQVRVLTLEGGERRKAPKVLHFNPQPRDSNTPRSLAPISSVTTLVTRGQWNLMRDNRDFANILGALPNLNQWHGSYSKPKSKLYITIADFLPHLPQNITNLKLNLETDYRREPVVPPFFTKAAMRIHLCSVMAENTLQLEHLSYTGRVCHTFFDAILRTHQPRTTKFKSIDLTVKNCCRPVSGFNDSGSGIQDMSFIEAFEKLVLAAIRSLSVLHKVEYLRVRFVDLGKPHCIRNGKSYVLTTTTESVLPPLNPFFILQNDRCEGVWSEKIIEEMARVRPQVSFGELSHSFGNITYNKEGRMVVAPESPNAKITSLKLENYRLLAHRITIQ